MASIIRIKRSSVSGNPSTLAAGELAYSALTDNGANGGDRLYIGIGTETGGNAANHIVIGGKYFTDLLDHSAGTLTANSALIVDANKKIDDLYVDNLQLNGNTISTTDTNGNLTLNPNGTGLVSIANAYTLPRADGTSGYVLTTDGLGSATWAAASSSLGIAADSGSGSIALLSDTITFVGGEGIDTSISGDTVIIAAEVATSSNLGVASFDATDFTVTSGAVTLNDERIQDIVGGMVSSNTESGIGVSYDDTSGKLNFDVNDPTITIAGDVDGSATMTNLGNTTINVTLDTVNADVGSYGSSTAIPVITVNAKGLITGVTTSSISTTLTVAADTGTPDGVALGSDTLSIVGGEGIDTSVTNNTITITGEDASTSNKGIASFSSSSFDVTSGAVSIKSGGVSNDQLANSSVTIGSTTVSLGGTSTTLAGITELTVDNLNFNSNTIAATNANGNIVLAPLGSGTVDVSGKKISGVATPESDTDAANKLYVDTVAAEGLHVQEGVDAATTDTLATLSGGTVTYNNGTSGVGATLTTTGSFTTGNPIDGVALTLNPTKDPNGGGRVLVKNETNAAHNGIYYLINATTLERDPLFDSDPEVEGGDFVFVVEGTINAGTGWVQTATVNVIGTDAIVWSQFSGAGTYTAGSGLLLDGTEFSVKLATDGGLEFSGANAVQLKAGVAGDGLSYSTGVISVGGTSDRITVTADGVDIASTYVGQTSITTLGTVTTGTWSGTAIATTKGGTGLTSYTTGDLIYASGTNTLAKLAAGADGKVLQINASGVPVWGDIDGGTY